MLFVHKTTYLACADICHPTLPGLDTFARHLPTIFPGLDTFARHSPTISPDSIHSLTFDIRHFWEKCDSPRHIRTSNLPFWQIWGEWPLLNWNANILNSRNILVFLLVFDCSFSLQVNVCLIMLFYEFFFFFFLYQLTIKNCKSLLIEEKDGWRNFKQKRQYFGFWRNL